MSFKIENHVLIRYKEENQETEVIIPEGVEIISRQSFFRSKYLEILTIPPSVHTIEFDAFKYCYDLKEIRITEGIANVDKSAFSNSYELTTITYKEISLSTNFFYTTTALKMLAQKNCRASVPDFMKYPIIGAMFFYHPEDEKIIRYIQKDLKNTVQYLIIDNQIKILKKMLDSRKFIHQKNIDAFIRCAISNHKYEIQAMLINYKNRYIGFQDITEKLKL